MQNLKGPAEFFGRGKISLGCESRHFSQTNRGKKQQKKPCCAPDVSAGLWPEKPGNSGDGQHHDAGNAPAVVRLAGAPPTSEDEQWRNDRKEEKDVIEIQSRING